MRPFEKIRKHAIYDIHGSAFACKDFMFSFPGGGGCKSVHTLGGCQEKYSLQQGEGAKFPILLRTYFMDDPKLDCRVIIPECNDSTSCVLGMTLNSSVVSWV